MSGFADNRSIATVALVVENYDEAIAWYVDRLGFVLSEDVDLGGGKRWVTVTPANRQGARLLLAAASGERQASR
ncbi:VOC family protein, partial [Mesorhizobium sp.]